MVYLINLNPFPGHITLTVVAALAVTPVLLEACYQSQTREEPHGSVSFDGGTPADANTPLHPDAYMTAPDSSPLASGQACVGDPLQELDPTEAVEYLSLRVAYANTPGYKEIDRGGTPCASARDRSTCQSKLESTPPGLPFDQVCADGARCQRYLVTTRFDDVVFRTSRQQLLNFLGGIGTPDEALLLLHYDGYQVLCAWRDAPGMATDRAGLITGAEGFESQILRRDPACPLQASRVTLLVERDGTVREIRSVLLSEEDACGDR